MYDQAAHDRRETRMLAAFTAAGGASSTFAPLARIVALSIVLSPFARRRLARDLPAKVVGR